MGRIFKFAEGEYYHIFNRGVDKRIIFYDQQDKDRFQKLLFLCNSNKSLHYSILKEQLGSGDALYQIEREEKLVAIGAYCLMGSHFHLLVREEVTGGISRFMQKLATAYTMYFNIRNQRTGSLLQGRFKAKHAPSDDYLKYLFSYIHLNPVEHIVPNWKESGVRKTSETWSYISKYRFSSLADYLTGSRIQKIILSTKSFPSYFKNPVQVKEEIFSWLLIKPPDFMV